MTQSYLVDSSGGPEATEKEVKQFQHGPDCLRAGQPFIRMVFNEISVDYACYSCKRTWNVIHFPGDIFNHVREDMVPTDWWGWRYAQALEVAGSRDMQPIWVQETGHGLAHLLHPRNFYHCGRRSMLTPLALPEGVSIRKCKRCRYRMDSFLYD